MTSKVQKAIAEWKTVVVYGFLVILVAAFLRFYNLNALPVFADEAIYVRWSQVMRAEPTLRFMPLSDGKQPLFMWGVIPFLKLISDPLVAARTVSALSGLGAMAGIFVLSYLLFKSKKIGLITVFLYALSPFAVFFDRMALVDSTLSMFGVWFLIFSIVTVRTLRLDTAMITGFALGGALLTKSPAVFFVLLLPTTVLLFNVPKSKRKRNMNLAKLGGLWLVTVGIGYAMYNILRLGPNFHLLSSRTKDYVYPLNHIFTSPWDPLLPYIDRALEYFMILGPVILVLFAVGAVITNIRSRWKELLILLIWTAVPIFIVSEFSLTMTARYIYFTFPFVCVLAGSVFLPYLARDRSLIKGVLILGLVVFALLSFQTDYYLLTNPTKANLPRSERSGYLEEWTAGTGIREASEGIRNEYLTNPNEKIVVGTEGYFGTLPDGLQMYLNDTPEITAIGVGLNFTKVPIQLIESRDSGNKTYFLVNSSRLKIAPDDLGLELIDSWAKADRPDNIREFVQHGLHDDLYLFKVGHVDEESSEIDVQEIFD